VIVTNNINVLGRCNRLSGTAAEQPWNSRLTAADLREQQRAEQPGTAGLTFSIDNEKQPRRAATSALAA
jgi:hypothetical protein